jgi:hypothetical protein
MVSIGVEAGKPLMHKLMDKNALGGCYWNYCSLDIFALPKSVFCGAFFKGSEHVNVSHLNIPIQVVRHVNPTQLKH